MNKRRFLELVRSEKATHVFWEQNKPADFVLEYDTTIAPAYNRKEEHVIRSMLHLGTIVSMTDEEAMDEDKVDTLKHLAAEKAWTEIVREFGFEPGLDEINHAALCVGIEPWKLHQAIRILKGMVE